VGVAEVLSGVCVCVCLREVVSGAACAQPAARAVHPPTLEGTTRAGGGRWVTNVVVCTSVDSPDSCLRMDMVLATTESWLICKPPSWPCKESVPAGLNSGVSLAD
jgi:hypothetical protein